MKQWPMWKKGLWLMLGAIAVKSALYALGVGGALGLLLIELLRALTLVGLLVWVVGLFRRKTSPKK